MWLRNLQIYGIDKSQAVRIRGKDWNLSHFRKIFTWGRRDVGKDRIPLPSGDWNSVRLVCHVHSKVQVIYVLRCNGNDGLVHFSYKLQSLEYMLCTGSSIRWGIKNQFEGKLTQMRSQNVCRMIKIQDHACRIYIYATKVA